MKKTQQKHSQITVECSGENNGEQKRWESGGKKDEKVVGNGGEQKWDFASRIDGNPFRHTDDDTLIQVFRKFENKKHSGKTEWGFRNRQGEFVEERELYPD